MTQGMIRTRNTTLISYGTPGSASQMDGSVVGDFRFRRPPRGAQSQASQAPERTCRAPGTGGRSQLAEGGRSPAGAAGRKARPLPCMRNSAYSRWQRFLQKHRKFPCFDWIEQHPRRLLERFGSTHSRKNLSAFLGTGAGMGGPGPADQELDLRNENKEFATPSRDFTMPPQSVPPPFPKAPQSRGTVFGRVSPEPVP